MGALEGGGGVEANAHFEMEGSPLVGLSTGASVPGLQE